MRTVISSMFHKIGYDAEAMTLTVQFHPSKKQREAGQRGDMWEYKDVIPDVWAEAEAVLADPERSIGKWFLNTINGKYEGRKVEQDDANAN